MSKKKNLEVIAVHDIQNKRTYWKSKLDWDTHKQQYLSRLRLATEEEAEELLTRGLRFDNSGSEEE